MLPDTFPAPGTIPFRCGDATERQFVVHRDGDRLSVVADGRVFLRLRLDDRNGPFLSLERPVDHDAVQALPGIVAAFETVSATHPEAERIGLDPSNFAPLSDALGAHGLALREKDALILDPTMLWQRPEPWLACLAFRNFPARQVMSDGKRHPQRPPKPDGLIYSRFIPWLGESVAFRAATMNDVDRLHRWFNDPVVDAAWGEAGTRDKHEAYLAGILADPHMIPLVGTIGGEAFGYFEIYWAKENRLAPFYDVQDYDRGWHVLIGESRFRGRAYITAWLPSLMHALFLDDPRTQRIVGEPRADHVQQLRNLERSGFARIKTFDFPHKRAALVMLLRERFFGERLWSPAGGVPPAPDILGQRPC